MEKCTCQEDHFFQGCLSSALLLLFFNDGSLARIPQFSSSNSPQKLAHTLMRLFRGNLLPLWLWVSVLKPAAVNFGANENLSRAYAFERDVSLDRTAFSVSESWERDVQALV